MGGWGGGVNRLIDSEKLIEVYLLLPIRYRLNKLKKTMKKQKKQKTKKHAPLQDTVRGYIREISVAMFLQIQTDMYLKRGRKNSNWLVN